MKMVNIELEWMIINYYKDVIWEVIMEVIL